MKLLYIVPNVNNEGGVARVLSIKANYLVEKLGYDVVILTQNEGNSPLFYEYNKNISFQDIILKGNIFKFFITYKKELKSRIDSINPDIIIVADNGLKAYTIPFIIKTKIPILLEIHSSLYVEESKQYNLILNKLKARIIHKFKRFCANQYDKIIVETVSSINEWKIKDIIVIPNPLWFKQQKSANLKAKKVIAVGRHTYEKGFDRMLKIWQKVIEKYPDWHLDIYGKSSAKNELQLLARELNISNNVTFYEPVKNINEKYLEASIYLMTSRFEGFGMVLIEAMASGVPCIAYDCPCGPKAIIANNSDGFLIENDNENDFIVAVETLIENENSRLEMGEKSKESAKKYNIDVLMQIWDSLLKELVQRR